MNKDEIIAKICDIAVSGDEFDEAAVKAEQIKAIAACAMFFFRESPKDFEDVPSYIIAWSVFKVIKALAEEIDNSISDGVQLISDTAERGIKNAYSKP